MGTSNIIAFMKTSDPKPASTRLKLHRRYASFVFAFYMAVIMAFLMCCTIVAVHRGLDPGYWLHVMNVYMVAMPVAFCCVVLVRPLVRPLVMRLLAITVHS